MKELEEILRAQYKPNQFYVKEAAEMKGIELYSFESTMEAMQQAYNLALDKAAENVREKNVEYMAHGEIHVGTEIDKDSILNLKLPDNPKK